MADATEPLRSDARPHRPPLTRRMAHLLIILLLLAVLWMAAACSLQRYVLFPRHVIPDTPEPNLPAHAERWELDTEDGPVEAVFIPPPDATADEPVPAVIYAHGNGELIDFWIYELGFYNDMGIAVLLPEYRGYGRSAGSPSQQAIIDDFQRFHDRLAEDPRTDRDRIIFHGRSLGGAVLATLSRTGTPAAMILESTFTSTAAMARGFLVPAFLIRDPLPAREAVSEFPGPVLVLHGENDSVVPISHGRSLHEAAKDARMHTYATDHNEPMPRGPYRSDIQQFLADQFELSPPP